MATPNAPAMSGLKVAAKQVKAGKAVHLSLVQPAELHVSQPISSRTPCGPSLIQISGMPNLGTPAELNLDCAWHIATFSSSVICDNAFSTRSSMDLVPSA